MANKRSPSQGAVLPSTVICFGAPKEASLYFDKVFPFDAANDLLHLIGKAEHDPNCIPFDDDALSKNVLSSLVGDDIGAVKAYFSHLTSAFTSRSLSYAKSHPEYCESILTNAQFLQNMKMMSAGSGIDLEASLRAILAGKYDHDAIILGTSERVAECIFRAGYRDSPLWVSPIKGIGDVFEDDADSDENVVFAALSSVNLVDVDQVSWEQIIEFRRDEKSRAALRKLRVFFSESLVGKNKEYLADLLLARVEEQESVAKLWGFRTVSRSLGVALSKESLLTTSLGGIALAATGAPLSAAAAAAAAVSLGNCLLEFGNAVLERKQAAIERPTQYLTDLRNHFKRR
ncbi:MAG TPA: hypothetical protein VGC56_12495 [Allosphingosinicella sp.]|jgi:hypothetical protein